MNALAVAVTRPQLARPLSIVQIAAADEGGGAATVAGGLMRGFMARGHQVRHLVGSKRGDDPNVVLLEDDDRAAARVTGYAVVQRLLRRLAALHPNRGLGLTSRSLRLTTHPRALIARWHGIEDFEFPASHRLLDRCDAMPDIVHGHNLHGGFFDLRALASISARVPTVLTLHDMWLLTGHCAHSLSCDKWTTGCGACPDLTLDPPIRRDATAGNWRRKRDIYARSRLHIVTPSRWLRDRVAGSMLGPLATSLRVIANGVDTNVFHPGSRRAAREALRMPVDEHVILLTTGARGSMWKDDRVLREAMEIVASRESNRQVRFVAVGRESAVAIRGRAITEAVPYQLDPRVMARYYQAADLYLHAARADTFPLAVLEAMACGTPVIATNVGGIPEQIDAQSGVLVPRGDGAAMAEAVARLLACDDRRAQLAAGSVKAIASRFTIERHVGEYLDLFREVIG